MGPKLLSSAMGLDAEIVAHGFLDPNDTVAISFWIISISMVAATVFFLMESMNVSSHWKTSMNVGALVTLVAGVHYFYMREFWVQIHSSPILYRYIDWSITVPLQMIEFYLILSAVQPNLGKGMFFRLLLGTVAMLAFGYAGESKMMNPLVGFGLGMAGWGFILFEIFSGEAGTVCASGDGVNKYVKESFNTMRFIVTVGWSIYPLGYFFGYLMGAVEDHLEPCVQPCGPCEQDCFLLGHLGLRKEQHPGGEGGSPPMVSQLGWVHKVPLRCTHVSRMPVPEILRTCF